MPEERYDEQSEPATARRREEAREHGHVARSADLNAALVLLSALLALHLFGGESVAALMDATRVFLGGFADIDITEESASGLLMRAAAFAVRSALHAAHELSLHRRERVREDRHAQREHAQPGEDPD